MRIDILTLFPEMFEATLKTSIIGRAAEKNIVELYFHNIRDFSLDKHKRVDDYPYGGGLGMVMQCQPVFSAAEYIKGQINNKPHIILMSPRGKTFNQQKAKELRQYENMIIICGHYEGVDERVSEGLIDEEISIGDFVLTGGEIAAMAVVDAVVRLVPGALKEEASHDIESFGDGLLEYPQYTRPANFRDMQVPEILLSGHHANIIKWRRYRSLKKTYECRPELLDGIALNKDDIKMLAQIKNEKLDNNTK